MEHSLIQSGETAEFSDEDSTSNHNQETLNQRPTTSTPTTKYTTDKASGSRGPVSADAMDQPELADNPRRSLANSVNDTINNTTTPTTLRHSSTDKASDHRSLPYVDTQDQPELEDTLQHLLATSTDSNQRNTLPTYPEEQRSRRGTVSAEATASPELADHPLPSNAAGRGTDKRVFSHSPVDDEGSKASCMNQDNEGAKLDKVIPSLLGSSDNLTIPLEDAVTSKHQAIQTAQTSLPVAGLRPTTSTGGALLGSVNHPPDISLRRSARIQKKKATPVHFILNAELYDQWQAQVGGIAAPLAGCSSKSPPVNAARTSLPVAGSSQTAAIGGAPPGSAHSAKVTNLINASRPVQHSSKLPTSAPLLAVQWNVNGFFNNICDLEILVRDHTPAILAIQEVHNATVVSMNRSLSGQYKWILKRGENTYHSVAIGIRCPLPFSHITTPVDLPVVAAKISCPIPITVVSIYLPNQKVDNLRNRLGNFLDTLEEPILLLGDVNGHHQAWGKHLPNKRGLEVMELAESRNLVLLNDGSTTYTSGRRESTVDVSFASASITNRLLWYVSDDTMGSDHHPIGIQLDEQPIEISRRPRFLYRQADWPLYQEAISRSSRNTNPTCIAEFTEAIYDAAIDTIPRTSPTPGRKALHWWSPNTKAAVKARRKALRAAKRLPSEHPDKETALQQYRAKRNECRDTIRKAKKDSWENFLNEINPNQSITDLWGRVNALSGKRKARGFAINLEGGTTRDPVTVSNALGNYFASLSSIEGYSHEFRRKSKPTIDSIANTDIPEDSENSTINQPFSFDEFTLALSKARGGSSGPDEVGYPLIRNLPIEEKIKFLDLLNQEWLENTYPEKWRHSLVIPIPKPNASGHEVSNFRPISLTCCASKILERMVNRRLMKFLEEGGLLDHRQHAFRPGHGTNTYFATLSDPLHEAFTNGKHVELVTLDISKAYNRAWMPEVIEQLKEWGLKGHVLHFVKNFLTNRTFQVTLGNQRSRHFAEETGVPQGSVIAVTLFLVKMNGVFKNLPKDIFIFVYADDIVVMAVKETIKALRRKLIAATKAISTWAASAGFQLSASKSSYTHVCQHNHRVLNTPVNINGEVIVYRKTLRILGVTIDRHLTFGPHLEEVRNNCKTRINLLKSLAGRHPDANRSTRLTVSNAIINSRLTYGLEITYLARPLLVDKLAPVYNKGIRISSGLLPSTPGITACVESGVLPFDKFITRAICHRAISFAEKTAGNNEEGFILAEANRLFRELSNQELPLVSRIHWCGARGWDLPKIKIDLSIKNSFKAGSNPSAVTKAVAELQHKKYSNYTIRYSDGSVARGNVGIGISDAQNSIFYRLPDQCSIFSAEAAAAFIAATTPAERPIAVFTDSASVIAALASDSSKHSWIQGIQQHAPSSTVYIWIPGHCGVRGNVEADHLAAEGRQGAHFEWEVPGEDLKKWVTTVIEESWKDEWLNSSSLAIRRVKGDTVRWEDPPLHREQVVQSRLRSGHTRISHNITGDGPFHRICDLCSVPQSVEHIICHCPKYHGPRATYDIPGSIRDALGNDRVRMAALFCFLREAGLFDRI